MRLLTFHPVVASRPCEFCRQYQHKDEVPVGELRWTFGAVRTDRSGEPIPRHKGQKTPCEIDKNACPKGHWSNPVQLTDQNWRALVHYRECKAVGVFPDDAIVRRNAAIIRSEEDAYDRAQQEILSVLLRTR